MVDKRQEFQEVGKKQKIEDGLEAEGDQVNLH